MSEEVKAKLIQRRATIKAQLTRFKSYLEKWSEQSDEQQLIERLQKVKDLWNSFDEVQSNLDLLTADEHETISDNERAQFEETYFELVARAQRRLTVLSPPTAVENVGIIQGQPALQNMITKIKLPTISLPTFNGKYDCWLGFYDNFKSIVHDNSDLTPVQKLQYLRSSLKEEAGQVIQALETSAQNYEVAWDLLVERYDNRRIIIQSHIRALFELPGLTKEASTQLRAFDTALKHTRALYALGQPTESWDALLLHLIASKLDRNTHKEWERSLDGTDMPFIDEVWKFLKNRCHVLESINQEASSMSSQFGKNQPRSNNILGNPGQKTRQALTTSHIKTECVICKQGHNIYQCEQFLKLDQNERAAKVKSMKLCYNCLRANHLAIDCKSGPCKKCKWKHNTLLHKEDAFTLSKLGNTDNINVAPNAFKLLSIHKFFYLLRLYFY